MSNLSKLLTPLWGMLLLMFLAVLFISYAGIPSGVEWKVDHPLGTLVLTKQRFFYGMVVLLAAVNVLLLTAVKAASARGKVPPPGHKEKTLKIVTALKVMAVGANTFLIVLVPFLKRISGPANWHWILYVGPALMLFGLLLLSWVLLQIPKTPEKLHE